MNSKQSIGQVLPLVGEMVHTDRKPYVREELDALEVAITELSSELECLFNHLTPIINSDNGLATPGSGLPLPPVPMAAEIRSHALRIREMASTVNFLRFNCEI